MTGRWEGGPTGWGSGHQSLTMSVISSCCSLQKEHSGSRESGWVRAPGGASPPTPISEAAVTEAPSTLKSDSAGGTVTPSSTRGS